MKLSDMNTRELKKALCAIAAPVGVIAESETFTQVMKRFSDMKKANVTVGQMGAVFIRDVVPLLLETHEQETFAILSVLTGKTVDEIMEQNGMQTIQDIKESVDGTLVGFFK